MTPSDRLDAIRDTARRVAAANPRVFGSMVRREDSDLDVLVDATDDMTLFDPYGLREELEHVPQIAPLDRVALGRIPPKMRPGILHEARPL
jgi:predicted nucleotidyltransferase